MSSLVFIHPPMPLDVLYGRLSKAGSELPPQGLCLLASVARKKGINVKIIDCIPLEKTQKDVIDDLLKDKPDFIGFSVYTIFADVVGQMATVISEAFVNDAVKPIIIVGGAHITFMGKEFMEKYPSVDFGVFGEGEETLMELIDCISTGRNTKIRGILCRENSTVSKMEPRPFIKNLDVLPLPAWDLLPSIDKFYIPAGDSLKRFPSTGIVTSRGCPGKCYFCNPRGLGREIRRNSANYINCMIKDLIERYRIRDIYIQDDMFITDRENVVELCKILIRDNVDLTWSCHGRVDFVDTELLKLMKRAGCWQISFGFESGDQNILENINKNTTVEKNYQAVQLCKEAGLDVKGLFMIGNFGETRESIQKTLKFIKEAYMTDFHMTFFTPMPGTPSWKIWKKYGKFNQSNKVSLTCKPGFIPIGFTEEELVKYQKMCYRAFYLRPFVIWGYMLKLKEWKQTKKIFLSLLAFINYAVVPKVFKKTDSA
tara:strand:- start:1277 stop:2728 length:1452 start_codon:yes stop_codon:yes gene_type:complete